METPIKVVITAYGMQIFDLDKDVDSPLIEINTIDDIIYLRYACDEAIKRKDVLNH